MNVVVSGSSRGIGRAIVERFLAEGHRVWGYDVCEATIAHPLYIHMQEDIRDEGTTNSPAVQVLVNCAGTLDENEAIDVNLRGTICFTKRFVDDPELRTVLFIASASARNGSEFPQYVASKAGVVGYMKNLALKLAPRGITVNSISPGGVITEANQHILESPELYRKVLDETLLDKWAEPEEIAELAWFLTMVNRSITGEDILVDNGEMLKSNFIW